MIRALAHAKGDNTPVVIIGLDDHNVESMRVDHPVAVQLADFGLPPIIVVLFHGKTEAELIAQIGPKVGPNTILHDHASGGGKVTITPAPQILDEMTVTARRPGTCTCPARPAGIMAWSHDEKCPAVAEGIPVRIRVGDHPELMIGSVTPPPNEAVKPGGLGLAVADFLATFGREFRLRLSTGP